MLVAQVPHAAPAAPHEPAVVPGSQVPLIGSLQQPEVHGTVEEHALMQTFFTASHELAFGEQLASEVQPHWPPVATATHTTPLRSPAHAAHTPPLLPQSVSSVPVWHVPPTDCEQPPLQLVLASQLVVHMCVSRSHAWLRGQSVAERQPHIDDITLGTQPVPCGSVAQLPHRF